MCGCAIPYMKNHNTCHYFTCRHLRRRDPILASCVAGLVSEQEEKTAAMLFLTREHLYIWDKLTDCLIVKLSIKSCSISPLSTCDGVCLCFRTRSSSDKEVLPDRGYDMIRQYLQQSMVEDGGEAADSALVCMQGTATVDVEEEWKRKGASLPSLPPSLSRGLEGGGERLRGGGEGLARRGGGEGLKDELEDEGLVLRFDALCAGQFCAVWESITIPPRS